MSATATSTSVIWMSSYSCDAIPVVYAANHREPRDLEPVSVACEGCGAAIMDQAKACAYCGRAVLWRRGRR